MKCILVDDEPHARALLKNLISSSKYELEIVGEASDVDTAIEILLFEKPDILFLDIRIKKRLGFEVLDRFPNPEFKIVFTTAYDEYALDAFEYAAVHYMLKPYDQQTLDNAIQRCISASGGTFSTQKLTEHLNGNGDSHMLSIPNRSGTVRYPTKDILYLIGSGSYTEIYLTKGRTVLASKSIGHFGELIQDDAFMRCHKKYIINTAHVVEYEKGMQASVTMTDGRSLEVSRTHKSEAAKRLL